MSGPIAMLPRAYDVRPHDVAELGPEELVELLGKLLAAELAWFHLPRAISVPDGGIDGLSQCTSRSGRGRVPSRIGAGLIGWQAKASKDLSISDVVSEPFSLPGILKPAVADLLDARGAYALICGRELTADKRLAWQKELRAALRRAKPTWRKAAHVFDATLVADWCCRYPAVVLWVRERIRRPLPSTARPIGDTIPSGEIPYAWTETLAKSRDRLTELVRKAGSVARVHGARQVGKSRFVRESLLADESLASLSIVIDATEDIALRSHLRDLARQEMRAVVVVEECDEGTHQVIAAEIVRKTGSLSLVTIGHRACGPGELIGLERETGRGDPIRAALDKRWPGGEQLDRIVEDADGYIGVAMELAERWSGDTIPLISERTVWRFLEPERRAWAIDFETLTRFAELLAVFGPLELDADVVDRIDHRSLATRFGLAAELWPRAHRELMHRHLIHFSRGMHDGWRIRPVALARVMAIRFLEARSQGELADLLMDGTLPGSLAHRVVQWIVDTDAGARFDRVAGIIVAHSAWESRVARTQRLHAVCELGPISPKALVDLIELLVDTDRGNEPLGPQEIDALARAVANAIPRCTTFSAGALLGAGLTLASLEDVPRRTRPLIESALTMDPHHVLTVLEQTLIPSALTMKVGASALDTLAFDFSRRTKGASRGAAIEHLWRLFNKWWKNPEGRARLKSNFAVNGLRALLGSPFADTVIAWLGAERTMIGTWAKAIEALREERSPHLSGAIRERALEQLMPQTLEEKAALWLHYTPHDLGLHGPTGESYWDTQVRAMVAELREMSPREVATWVVQNVLPEAALAGFFGRLLAEACAEEVGVALFEEWAKRFEGRRTHLLLGFIDGARRSQRGTMVDGIATTIERETALSEVKRHKELYLDRDVLRLARELRNAIPQGEGSEPYKQVLLLEWPRSLTRIEMDELLERLSDVDGAVNAIIDILLRSNRFEVRADAIEHAADLLRMPGVLAGWVTPRDEGPQRLYFLADVVEAGHHDLGLRAIDLFVV